MRTITEEQIEKLRQKEEIPEYPDQFPPNLQGVYDDELVSLLGEASRSIGTINNYIRNVPNTEYLSYPLILKEAISSSKIEGTMANVKDMVDFEAGKKIPKEMRDDALETKKHVAALLFGHEILKKHPLYSRTIKEIHNILLDNVRGSNMRRGEFRIHSNAVSKDGTYDGIIYIPPKADRVDTLMSRLDNYVNNNQEIDKLIKAAIIHHEFEAIHPFADGNGRMGRTLVSLYMLKNEIIKHPLLFMSGYFFKYRDEYYGHLQNINKKQSWSAWIKFFLRGIDIQAKKSAELLDNISNKVDEYIQKVKDFKSPYNYQIVIAAFKHIVIDSSIAQQEIPGITAKAALENLRRLERIGLLVKTDPKAKRNIKYFNTDLIDLLND